MLFPYQWFGGSWKRYEETDALKETRGTYRDGFTDWKKWAQQAVPQFVRNQHRYLQGINKTWGHRNWSIKKKKNQIFFNWRKFFIAWIIIIRRINCKHIPSVCPLQHCFLLFIQSFYRVIYLSFIDLHSDDESFLYITYLRVK